MAKPNTPPPVLDGARLLTYAVVDESVIHIEKSTLYVDGKLLGAVPCLAICQPLNAKDVLLLFCNDAWSSVGVVGCQSVAEAKKRAESEYQGIANNWVTANTSEDEAARYLEQHKQHHCSFCGKSPNEVQQLFTTSSASICDGCVAEFYKDLKA